MSTEKGRVKVFLERLKHLPDVAALNSPAQFGAAAHLYAASEYTATVNADDKSLATKVQFDLAIKKPVFEYIFDRELERDALFENIIEVHALQKLLSMHQIKCRECGHRAAGFATGMKYVFIDVEKGSLQYSRDILIPICNVGKEHDACGLACKQRLYRFLETKAGKENAPARNQWNINCHYCKKKEHDAGVLFAHCQQCKVMHYCSKACQEADWEAGHKHICKPLAD